jgi:predicted amidohydrolase
MTKVALVQLAISRNQQKNRTAVLGWMKEAAQMGAELVCFPEGALTGYLPKVGQPRAMAIDDEVIKDIQKEAIRLNLEVYIGASISRQGKITNSYLQIADQIDWVDKTHLGQREAQYFDAGQSIRCLQSRLGAIGTAICLESHFPEIFTRCRELGAVIMLLPFASPAVCGSRGKMWRKILPARAYDNGIYVLATNLCGFDGDRYYSGGMMAVNPKGEILAEYQGQNDHMILVDVDMDWVRNLRITNGKTNYFDRRKPELYR